MLTTKAGRLFQRSILTPNPWCTLALIHGYGDHSGRHAHFLRWLAERGVACHAVDLRGHGQSEGRRGFVRRWDEYLDDLDAFLDQPALRTSPPLFLLGHSHGGLILAAAGIRRLIGVAGCVMVAPYFGSRLIVPRHKRWLARLVNPFVPWLRVGTGLSPDLMTGDSAMQADSRADPLMLRSATPRWYFETLHKQAAVMTNAARFRLPLLTLFGGADPLADESAARSFAERCGSSDKTMKIYPTLRHELLRETSREEVFNEILRWIKCRDGTRPMSS